MADLHHEPVIRHDSFHPAKVIQRAARRLQPSVGALDLRDEQLLLYTPPAENLFHQQFFKGAARSPEVVVMKLTGAMLSMVRAGLGVTIAARWAISSELASGRLAAVRLGPRGFRRTWFAATLARRGQDQPEYVMSFIDLLAASRAKGV